jgi:hypothetical protein
MSARPATGEAAHGMNRAKKKYRRALEHVNAGQPVGAQVSSVGADCGPCGVLDGSGVVAAVGEEEMPAAVAMQGVQGQERFVAFQ